MSEYSAFWRQYADFKGKTTRRGFWIAIAFSCFIPFVLFIILSIAAMFVLGLTPEQAAFIVRLGISVVGLVSLVPLLAITVRRLRDGGFTAKSFLWLLLPGIGGIALFVRLCAKSKIES